MSSLRDKTVNMSGLWRCSICTYDNNGSSLCCDMCGVFQDSSVNLDKDGEAVLPSYKELCGFLVS